MTAHEIELLDKETDRPANLSSQFAELIFKSLKGLDFGSVEIIVHESKVVQVERKEKFRLPKHNA